MYFVKRGDNYIDVSQAPRSGIFCGKKNPGLLGQASDEGAEPIF